MTLLSLGSGLLDEAWVALDLETTGLSSDEDQIIEVGAVRFRGAETLDTFQSFVNPGRRLDPFVTRLTGITNDDLRDAPGFSSVAAALAAFVGSSPLVGHNIAFDLGFLDRNGFTIQNRVCDTWELAYFLLRHSQATPLTAWRDGPAWRTPTTIGPSTMRTRRGGCSSGCWRTSPIWT